MSEEIYTSYFNGLKQLLSIEKKEDQQLYETEIKHQSIQERKASGITWYPIFIKSEYYGFADYLCLDIERKYESDSISLFSTGDKVEVFTQQESNKEDALIGTVLNCSGNVMTIQLQVDEAPHWLKEGKIGVNRLFDLYSYEVMESTLDYWKELKLPLAKQKLRSVLLKEVLPSRKKNTTLLLPKQLDKAQQESFQHALETEDVAVIHGPPGTGKTTTLVEIVKALHERGERVLVCAASNAAVDVLTERIAASGIKTVRVGNPSKVTEDNLKFSLSMQVTGHTNYSVVRELHKRADEFYRMANKYHRNFGREERDQRKAILKEAKALKQQAESHRIHIQEQVLTQGSIVTCTPVVSEQKELKNIEFDVLLFDEAGQALEPITWIPIKKVSRVIFCGDHLQLPPTVKSEEAQKNGLAISLMEKLSYVEGISSMLKTQYRMHQTIMQYSSGYFYGDQLIAHESVASRKLSDPVVSFIDTAGTGYEEQLVKSPFGLKNDGERVLVGKIVNELLEQFSHSVSIGVISPYKQQVLQLKEDFIQHKNIQVQTVDSFQGQEKDIIIISLVRSNDKQDIGFLKDLRRMNVAITRARKKLVIIGDSGTIGIHPFYEGLIQFIDQSSGYRSAYEWL
ncbi:MAG: AAA domain-containing protein [Cytophagaceae bacterium]|jgi:superfamily I DNA and/or RNA helicase|nr:AAA domain-containing protein [Cytophagaceae bacterium]